MEIFVSHSLKDPLKDSIRHAIATAGAVPYFAEHNYSLDETVTEKVEAAIQRCDLFLVLLTSDGYNAAFVQQEIGYAHAYRKRRIILVEKNVEGSTSGFLYGYDHIVFDRENPQRAIDKLGVLVNQINLETFRSDRESDSVTVASSQFGEIEFPSTLQVIFYILLVILAFLAIGAYVNSRRQVVLYPPVPNPFNSSTRISFDLAGRQTVSLAIFNRRGRKVGDLIPSQTMSLGSYSVVWDARKMAAGGYVVRLEAGNQRIEQTVILEK